MRGQEPSRQDELGQGNLRIVIGTQAKDKDSNLVCLVEELGNMFVRLRLSQVYKYVSLSLNKHALIYASY